MVAGWETAFPGQGPDLQEVHGRGGGVVVLGVGDAAAAGGELHVAAEQAGEVVVSFLVVVVFLCRLCAVHRVAVRELAGEDV